MCTNATFLIGQNRYYIRKEQTSRPHLVRLRLKLRARRPQRGRNLLAFLATLQCSDNNIPPPRALVGISGIYDFPQIHRTNPDYIRITVNAMDARYFAEASSVCHTLEEYVSKWKMDGLRKVVLAHSKDDGLVEWGQVTRMQDLLAAGNK